ncbi:hypothetical protein CPB86DRAFT_787314 [Serendipita vermifera]|nr:hypothetical protein CPB86DRAFT_787314 [Serendipita vermifera]
MSRSQSRGREGAVYSTGRGGAGNIRPVSRDPVARGKGPDDFSPTRGRELPAIGDTLIHTGRGGAGNVRSVSRDGAAERKAAQEVNAYVQEHQDPNAPISHGRGGYGNIDRSRSRSKEPRGTTNPVHTYGHGGAGNVASGYADNHLRTVEEDEAKAHHQPETIHSTGRGGAGNIVSGTAPSTKAESAAVHTHHQQGGHISHGRGGAGNID